MQLFGTSGIRAVVDKRLIGLAFRVGLAVGRGYGSVVTGSDTRTSAGAMKCSLVSGLLAAGARCADAGIVPTPTLALAAREYKAGVVVTASHNPPEYNGLKLWNPDGSAFGLAQQEQVEAAVLADTVAAVSWGEMKPCQLHPGAVEDHIARIVQDFPEKLKVKVVVDAACGAAAEVTPRLLERLGCEVVALNCRHSGFFPRPAEPVEANLEELKTAVKASGAALGIAHDGDADRAMAVDELGRFIPGDKLLVMLAQAAGAREVVTTVDASMVIEEMGFITRRTRVGDSAVSEELKRGGEFGGETSGAWIFPAVSLCPDGIYAAAVMAAMARRQRLSALADSLPAYPLVRDSIPANGIKYFDLLREGLLALEPESVDTRDGFRLGFRDGWLLVRASGTEPKIRLTAEAKDSRRVRELHQAGVKVVEDCLRRAG